MKCLEPAPRYTRIFYAFSQQMPLSLILGISLAIPISNTLRNDFTTKAFKRPHVTLYGFSLPCPFPSLSPVPDQPFSCSSEILTPNYLIFTTPMCKRSL